MVTIAITHIGELFTGDLACPVSSDDTLILQDGRIVCSGGAGLLDRYTVDQQVDAGGMTVTPGLIDSHVHPVIGDYTPRQKTQDFLDSALHGGVTTFISAGEPHTPGRPKDPAGVKALAVLGHKSFANLRSSGLKVHAGAVILEKGLVEADFAEMAKEGVWLVGEVGLGSVKDPAEARQMVDWAKKYNMKIAMHTGGTSIPSSSTVTAADVMAVSPTLVSHANGGPTAISPEEVRRLVEETQLPLEIVQCGNPKIADLLVRKLAERNELQRVVLGNDAPSGTGVIPLGILRTLCQLASLSGIPVPQAVAMATGNTARVFGLECGLIAPGKEADLVIMDAPLGSVGKTAAQAIAAGDIPGIALVMVDGVIRVNKSRNTPPAARTCRIQ
ncbi:MAG TPA: amidohydrolase family protein [Patescibacteria group bacterium]|nr:amidohydrolase family protein [Patescibacteria group bacterium]